MASVSAIIEQTYSFTEILQNGATASGNFVVDYSYSDANGSDNLNAPSSAFLVSENITIAGGNSTWLNNTISGDTGSITLGTGDNPTMSFVIDDNRSPGKQNELSITFTDNFVSSGSTGTAEYMLGQHANHSIALTGMTESYQTGTGAVWATPSGVSYASGASLTAAANEIGDVNPYTVEQTYSFTEVLSHGETAAGTFVVDYSYSGDTDKTVNGAQVVSENIKVTGGGTWGTSYYDNTFSTATGTTVNVGSTDPGTFSFAVSSDAKTNGFTDTLNITFTDNFVNGGTVTPEYINGLTGGHTVNFVGSSEVASKGGTQAATYTDTYSTFGGITATGGDSISATDSLKSAVVEQTYALNATLGSHGETVTGNFVVDYSYSHLSGPDSATLKSESITVSGGSTYLDRAFTSITGSAGVSSSDAATIGFTLDSSISSTKQDELSITFTGNFVNGGTATAEYLGGPTHAFNTSLVGAREIYQTLTNTFSSSWSNSTYNDTLSSGTITCYAKGTLIATADGELPVEKLREGDFVLTLSGDLAPVKWLGHRRVDCKRHPNPEEAYPVRIVQDAFAPNVPSRDLLLSALHSVYVDGVFVPAIDLVNDVTIFQEVRSKITYYHVELPSHNVIFAEGLTAETYLDDNNRDFFVDSNAANVISLEAASMPKMTSAEIWAQQGFAKVFREGPEVQAIREKLLERAQYLITQAKIKSA